MAPPEVVNTKPFPQAAAVKERPILFSAPMVRALLDGTKTQTRRVVKPQPIGLTSDGVPFVHTADDEKFGRLGKVVMCPYGQPSDRLWVREAWRVEKFIDNLAPRELATGCSVVYEASGEAPAWRGKLRPSMFMPRRMSRITLEVTGVRVERLQDISEADAVAEGIERLNSPHPNVKLYRDYAPGHDSTVLPVYSYQTLWEQINGPDSWATNPWVWVVEFRRIRP